MKRVFMVGFPRSGTTLVQSILGAHLAVATFPETHFFEGVVPRWPLVRSLGCVRPDALRIRRRLEAARVPWRPGPRDMLRPGLGTWSRQLVTCLDEMARERGRDVWLEKTPGHYAFIPEISRHVDGVAFVHVLRSGIDAISSFRRAVAEAPRAWGARKFWVDQSSEGLARRWVDAVTTTLSYAGDPRHHVVAYGDVLDAPSAVARRAFDWLGIEAGEAVVGAVLARRAEVAADVVLESEGWKSANTEEIGARSNAAWTGRVIPELSPGMRRTIAQLDARIEDCRSRTA